MNYMLCDQALDLRLVGYSDADWAMTQISTNQHLVMPSFFAMVPYLGIVACNSEPVTIHCGSMAALTYAKDPKYHGKTKHIDIRYHFICDMVAQKEVVLKHISTSRMVARLIRLMLGLQDYIDCDYLYVLYVLDYQFVSNIYF